MTLSESRLSICAKCPLYKLSDEFGPVCDSTKFISKNQVDWSFTPIPGYIKGCGCHLKYKTANALAHCICGKW